MTTATNSSNHNQTAPATKDVVNPTATAEAHDGGAEKDGDWADRAPFTAAFLRQFDAARTKLTSRIDQGQKGIDELQKKARDLVGQVQAKVDQVGDKVTEEAKGATDKLDDLRTSLGSKWPLRIDLDSWLKMPEQAREEVLHALGIASDKKISRVNANIDKLREELTVLTEAQTSVLKELITGKASWVVAPAAAPTKKPAPRKAAAAKPATKTSAKTTARKPAARKPVAKSNAK